MVSNMTLFRLALVGMLVGVLGCGTCACGRGPDLSLQLQGPAECITPCGMAAWFGAFGPADCAKLAAAEAASVECFGTIVPGGSPAALCSGMKGAALLLNSESPPPYGNTWVQPKLVIEIFNGADWRVNAWVHEMGHVTQWVFMRKTDPGHLDWTRDHIYDAMRCAGDRIYTPR